MPFAVWITGLPGSGKSTIAKELIKHLENTEYLRLDEIRKKYIEKPRFTDEERDRVYRLLIEDGAKAYKSGRNVVFDATAHRLAWRNEARKAMEDFLEVRVTCPIGICMERESARKEGLVLADLYRKALERKRSGKEFEGLGKVVGVDVPYEENGSAEIVIDSRDMSAREAADAVLKEIKRRGWAK